MIATFKDKTTRALFEGGRPARFRHIERVAIRKLQQIDAATDLLRDLGSIPGNRLKLLGGDRTEQWSIRINDQWRICFVWMNGDATEVEIVDYH